MAFQSRELRSTAKADGTLTLSIDTIKIDDPAADEVVVRMEAAPINPSDLGLLLGPADVSSLRQNNGGLSFTIPEARRAGLAARLDQAMPVGNEGAGTVIAAGADARHLEGRKVALYGGTYADYRKAKARDVVALPDGASAADGASIFINPMTALGFVETARMEGYKAIVHTAAASNLGQMLQRICLADGVPLINIVRSEEQAAILRAIGATRILNSHDADFTARLADAIAETQAYVAFDAIGGGTLASTILHAMEAAAARDMAAYSRYGSDAFKQVFIYGTLDPSPTVIDRSIGYKWAVSGWLVSTFFQRAGGETFGRMRQRVLDELTTTFASHYTRTIGLAEALDPDVLSAYERKATGEKYLIDPTRG